MSQKIKTIKEGVGIRGERVKLGTVVTVLPDKTKTNHLLSKPLQIRQSVAVNLVAKGRAEIVEASEKAAK